MTVSPGTIRDAGGGSGGTNLRDEVSAGSSETERDAEDRSTEKQGAGKKTGKPRIASEGGRRRQILEALARELEAHPGDHITTAALAKAVGVSEAALYRHFPSKARMFEELIAFAEEAVFGFIHRVAAEQPRVIDHCEQLVFALLSFSERNPGITRILIGDALTGENERLRDRAAQFFERLETELRQLLRSLVLAESPRLRVAVPAAASLLMGFAAGRMVEFVRGDFRTAPTAYWPEIWPALATALFE